MKQNLALLGLVVLASACGKKQNPIGKYSDVPVTQPYEQIVQDQKFAVCAVQFDAPSTLIVTEEGKTSGVISVRGLAPKSKLTLKDAPEGVTLIPLKSDDGLSIKYSLQVKGDPSLIPAGKDAQGYEVQVVPPTSSPSLDCSEKVGIVVVKSKTVPVIKKVSKPSLIDLSKDEDRTISVEILAPGTHDPLNLIILREFDLSATSKELPVLDLSPAVRVVSQPQRVKEDLYQVQIQIVPEILRVLLKEKLPKDYKKPEIESLVALSIYNKDTEKMSVVQNVVVKLKVPAKGELR